jgi:hypothetical protein
MEYATNTSSPTVASAGGGRLQPFELTSDVSMDMVGCQVLPESDDVLTTRSALLSLRTAHHTANARVVPSAAASDRVQPAAARGVPTNRTESAT